MTASRHRGEGSTRGHPANRRGLRKLRDVHEERFGARVVSHTGPRCVRYADDKRTIALPVNHLWSDTET